ncbi:MAG: hypothetical protein GY749_48635 [Desulfobacteraceae bacterium]|nr:hypothetical protein [Desulfobacteraceae bacterium]
MDNLGKLKFKNVILTTNGYDLESYLTSVAPAVHSLVFSIDTLDHEKADQWYGMGQGAFQNILYNAEQAANLEKRKYEIIISSVITPDNINDLYNVYEYSKDRGFIFAACPQLVGVRAHHSLTGNPDYHKFLDFLISEKKKGNKINGTVLYLEYMRDLKKFSCHPFTMLLVSPVGQVFYPCLEIGNLTGNLFDNDSLHNLRQKGCKQFGPQPECGNQCHSACALGFSLILNYPLSILHETFLVFKSLI